MIREHKVDQTHSARAVRATIWAGLNTLIPMLTSFGVLIVTSRMLTPSDFGVVALATGIALLGSAICPGGFGEAIVQRLELSPRHLDAVFWLCISCGCVVYFIECELAKAAARFFKVEIIAVLVPVIGSRLISDMAAVVPNALITRSMSFHIFAIRSLVASIVAAAITIGLLLKGYGLWALVVSQLTTSFVTAIASFLTTKWYPRLSFSFSALQELFGYGLFSSATQNITSLVAQNEQILVGFFLGTMQLGLYNFSKRVILVLNSVVSGSLGAVAHPMFSGIQNDTVRVRRAFLSAQFVSALLSFPIFIGLAFVSGRMVPIIFGHHWLSAVIFVQIQCALGLLTSIGALQAGLINSQGKANWWFYYQLLSNVTTIAVIAAFAHFGIRLMMTLLVIRAYAIQFIPIKISLMLLSMKASDYFWNFKAPLFGTILMGITIYVERFAFKNATGVRGLAIDIIFGAVSYSLGVLIVERQRIITILATLVPRLKYFR
jgi:O-antigen/teichoic acid export membrane protein